MTRPTSQRTLVSRLFATSTRPIYLLDASRRIIYGNEALAHWVSRSVDELLGLRCSHEISDSDLLQELGRQLSPPPQTLDESSYQSPLTVTVDGRASHRSASFYLLGDDIDAAVTLVIVDSADNVRPSEEAFDADTLHRKLYELRQQWSEHYHLDQLIGSSTGMQQVRRQIRLAASESCHVVISGARGSGREHIARSIHHQRTDGRSAIVPLSCQLLDLELIEVALLSFQYEQETSDGSSNTLLLLEVDQLPLDAQAKLVAFLTESGQEIATVATSTAPLSVGCDASTFRRDLAHRLTSLQMVIPPLVERLADVPELTQWFVEKYNAGSTQPTGGFHQDALQMMLRYGWPGEVAELQAIVTEACRQSDGLLITPQDLPVKLTYAAGAEAVPARAQENIALEPFLAEIEAELILRALRQAKGNKAQAARMLSISRAKLLRRIEQLGVEL